MREFYSVNEGYAFVTFSFIDEARVAMLLSSYLNIDGEFLDVYLKNDLDHGDFDIDYIKA